MSLPIALYVCLALSAVGILLGASLGVLAPGRSTLGAVVDGFARGVVPCLVALRIIPHLVGRIGVAAVAFSVLGYVLFSLAERGRHRVPSRLALSAVMFAFGGHSLVDGATLSLSLPAGTPKVADLVLASAIVGHRMPEGVIVGKALLPYVGARWTIVAALALAGMTILGATAGQALGASLPDFPLHIAVAVAMGMLVRLILHGPRENRDPLGGAMQVIGATVGCCVAFISDR